MNKQEKYYLEDIFDRFIKPHFTITEYIVLFEWDRITRSYRYVVTPKWNKNKFISFYLRELENVKDFEMVVIYTSVGEFNFHNVQKLLYLLTYDNLERFNHFYKEFIYELKTKSVQDFPFELYTPFFIRDNQE